MASEAVTIADAVKTELSVALRFSLPLTVSRLYEPETELDAFADNTMYATVLIGGLVRETASRGKTQVDYAIPVVFQHKLDANDDSGDSTETQLDPLMNVVQEVADWFDVTQGKPLTTYTGASLVGITNEPAYDMKSLEENGLFASVLILAFRTWRSKR